ncbi:Twin-arginine translocation pathway signal [Sterolibacterium denitrificans]|uniref:Twin-arginine translocation pathway signal n=1 Tax=Sterolibacterium denitrificans TaxID=157592 RepID=A0A7Z7MUV8_9PROT|nr:DUF1513 domain-containing protein [Sterolibacterium denitrificans]SMB24828.1 Twin-arginine translocation pathway signal [Sterolibacterium denitrificans]
MNRRHFLLQLSAALGVAALPSLVRAQESAGIMHVAGGWRMHERDYQIGALRVDWQQNAVAMQYAITVPTLPHAIVPEPGGGFLAVATRPGAWLMRVDAEGRLANQLSMADEGDARTFDGHVIASNDGQWLYTGETDRKSGEGWVGVRDARDLRKVAEHRTRGIDPHQILVDAKGRLVIANGGIPRTPTGAKRNLERMDPTLVHLDAESGEQLGVWSLRDKRLSPHHIAWNRPLEDGPVLLGIGLQAEHDDSSRRRQAPLLAVWDGQELTIPSHMVADGYAGDVAAGPNGGFVLTAQHANRIMLWQPQKPAELMTIGNVQNPCGLWPLQDAPGVAIGGDLGLARWHPGEPAGMLRWPQGMAAGNHWAILA